MTRHVCLAALTTLLAAVSAFADPTPTQMKLFLLIGQLNMSGCGKVEAQDMIENPRIFMLTKNLQWVPAKDPLHFDKPIAGVGLGSEFARETLKADPNANIGLIPCALSANAMPPSI